MLLLTARRIATRNRITDRSSTNGPDSYREQWKSLYRPKKSLQFLFNPDIDLQFFHCPVMGLQF